MAARPQQVFFSYLEHMLHEQALRPGNFLPALLYLNLLCLPSQHWHAPDLLRFPSRQDWEKALIDEQTWCAVEQRLSHYPLLALRLRNLLLYLASRPRLPNPSSRGKYFSPSAVTRLLDTPAFLSFLDEQVSLARHQLTDFHFSRHLFQEKGIRCLHWFAPELYSCSLPLLVQQGWLEMVAAKPKDEFALRFLRVPIPVAA